MNNGQKLDNRPRNTPKTLVAPAKINVGLRVIGRRPDGYHLLESLFWPIDLADNLSLSESPTNRVHTQWGASLKSDDRPLPTERENLVYRLLNSRSEAGLPALSVDIEKNIPIGGGLGGGSSNVGALLRHGLGARTTDAISEALLYGADVPFFLNPVPSWVTGIGEKIEPLEVHPSLLEELTFLIVCLPEPTLTADVFRSFKKEGSPFSPTQPSPRLSMTSHINFASYLKTVANDLEPHAVLATPRVGRCLAALRKLPSLYVGLSGSGSTCFAIFSTPHEAQNSLKVLSQFLRTEDCKGIIARTFVA